MRSLAPTLLLLASPALAASPGTPAPVSAPTPVVDLGSPAPAPVAAPLPVESQVAPATAPVAPSAIAAPPSSGAQPAPAKPPAPVVPPQALVEKIGQGDRLFLAADYRNALFAYQDAVYMEPRYAPARVRLGRAYLALRYPAQALAQAEAALAAAPDDAEAKKLLEEARNPSVRPVSPAPDNNLTYAAPAAAAAPATRSTPRVFRFSPEADPSAAATSTPAAASAAAPATPPERVITIVRTVPASTEPQPAAPAHDAQPAATPADDTAIRSPAAAAQHYRAALVQLQDREWVKAVAELTRAIRADPSLAVAHAARGSAFFGLGKYREAADDYRTALTLDRNLATPLFGLAECYRVLGDAKNAVEMYGRYADSGASDVRPELRTVAAKRAQELR